MALTVAITDRDEEAEAQEAVESVTPEEAAAQALKDGAAETGVILPVTLPWKLTMN